MKLKFLALLILFPSVFAYEKIAIIGTGYVGLIAGAGLAEIGNKIICADIDENKITMLNNGMVPIFEPGLEEILNKNKNNIEFTTDVSYAIRKSDIIFVAVGTPMGDDGCANLTALNSVAKTISQVLKSTQDYKIIVIKSTVPTGTNRLVKRKIIENIGCEGNFDIVSNPEFLRAGSALRDFFETNPVILGSDSHRALNILEDLYKPLIGNGIEIIKTNYETSETIKYSWNSFSAIRIAYVNELSRFCNAFGADVFTVVKGMSFSEKLLPSCKIKPGPGIGGSCLPKDTSAFIKIADRIGINLRMVKSFIESNEEHKEYIIEKLYGLLEKNVKGKTVCVLGLSFKANTDDIRKSPAIDIIGKLLDSGTSIKAYDPRAMDNMRKIFPEVQYCDSALEAIEESDAIVILADWNEFKSIDLNKVRLLMRGDVIIDSRNVFNIDDLKSCNFKFLNLGVTYKY